MQTKFTRASRRHKIGRAHVFFVIHSNEPMEWINTTGESEFYWRGRDDRGVEIEIAAVLIAAADRTDADTDEDLLLILHVMPIYRT